MPRWSVSEGQDYVAAATVRQGRALFGPLRPYELRTGLEVNLRRGWSDLKR